MTGWWEPELALRKALWHAGHRGYRLHYKIKLPSCLRRGGTASVTGWWEPEPALRISPAVRPDISFVSKKLAIFVNGCYWHRCPRCNYPLPKNNPAFWQAKFDRNVTRDARKRRDLKRIGWKVITVWECDLNGRPDAPFSVASRRQTVAVGFNPRNATHRNPRRVSDG